MLSTGTRGRTALTVVPPFTPTPTDLRLERGLSRILQRIQQSQSRARKRQLWKDYRELHAMRSQAMVAYLEAQKGIA